MEVNMSLSLFDIVGPVMVGPSSSHTAGAARIGFLAGLIAGSEPLDVILYFHPVLMQTYAGHRTHAALIGGLLGYREDDLRLRTSLQTASKRGITYRVEQIETVDIHQNTMRLKITTKDRDVLVNGVSIGGGCVEITEIDGVTVMLDGNSPALIVRSRVPVTETTRTILSRHHIIAEYSGIVGEEYLSCWILLEQPSQVTVSEITQNSQVIEVNSIPSLGKLPKTCDSPAFTNLTELVDLASSHGMVAAAVEYEQRRSGQSVQCIRGIFYDLLDVMRKSIASGFTDEVKLLGGFCAGDDGTKMLGAYHANRTICGGILGLGIAQALSVLEINGSMGRVVAAPTAGSAGVLPGVIFSIADRLGKTEDELCDSLLIAAAVGLCIANKASLSGAVGGCQAEIGVAAAMAASAATYLGGGDAKQCVQAAALTLKNLLGLICDPPAGPVEVPCIKRNAFGVAAALTGAEMSLAGIKSYIPPDEVVDALVNVEKLLPQELKGSTIGGLGCTCSGQKMRVEWQKKLKQMIE